MGVLPAQPGGTAPQPGREAHDARVGDATLVDLALPALEGSVARHRPAPRVVVVAQWPADLVDTPVHLVDARALEVGEPALVDGAVLAALRAGAVVGHHHHDGVVGVAQLVDEVEHPPDLLVGVGEEGGEALHEALGQRPLLGRRGCPSSAPRAGAARARCPRGRCPRPAGGRRSRRASGPTPGRSGPCSARSTRPARGAASGRPRWRSRGRTAARRRRRAGRRGTRWPGRPGRRSGGNPSSTVRGGRTAWLSW